MEIKYDDDDNNNSNKLILHWT